MQYVVGTEYNMGITYSPKIPTDGLVLALDAANTKSYPGTGTTWFDMSGKGNDATLVGGISLITADGSLVLSADGVTGSYIEALTPVLTTGTSTTIGVVKSSGASNGRIMSDNANWLLGHHGNLVDRYHPNGWVYSTGAAHDNLWRMYAGTSDTVGDWYQFYSNGNLIAENALGSTGPNGFSIGRYAPGNSEYGAYYISTLYAWDRVLTAAEIEQAHAVLRGRFNL